MTITAEAFARVIFDAASAPSIPEIKLYDIVSSTSIRIEILEAQGTSMKIAYRLKKAQNIDNWTYTTVHNSPVNGDKITITGLTANRMYEFQAFAYPIADGAGARSDGSNIITVVPTTKPEYCKDIADLIKTIMITDGNYNAYKDAIDSTAADILDNNIIVFPALIQEQYPCIIITPKGTTSERKYGNTKMFIYQIAVDVIDRGDDGLIEQLEQRISDYSQAFKKAIDADETLGGNVYRCEVKESSEPMSYGLNNNLIMGQTIMLEVQTSNG